MSRKTCPHCGSYNEETALFCDQCGASLREGEGRRYRSSSKVLGLVVLMLFGLSAGGIWYLSWRSSSTGGKGSLNSERETSPGRAVGEKIHSPKGKGRGTIGSAADKPSGEESEAVSGESPSAGQTSTGEEKGEFVVEPAGAVNADKKPLFLELVAFDSQAKRIASYPGAALSGNVIVCPLGVLVGASRIEVRWSQGSYFCRETVGWDLERGYCLLPFPESSKGFNAGEAFAGDEVVVVSLSGGKRASIVQERSDYGLSGLPLYVLKREASAAQGDFVFSGNDTLAGVSWYPWSAYKVSLYGQVLNAPESEGMAISQWNRDVWRGTSYDFLCRARDSYKEARYNSAFEFMESALAGNDNFWALLREPLTDSYVKWAGELGVAGELEEACGMLRRANKLLPESWEILLLLARHEATLGKLKQALRHTREALSLDQRLWSKHWKLLEERYVQYASSLEPVEAIDVLFQGMEELPESVRIAAKLGKLLFKERDYAEAALQLQRAYELSPSYELAELISQAEALAASENEVVVIPYSRTGGTIRANVLFAGHVTVQCIVDTGASYTAMPPWAARELGIRLEKAKRTRISTAGGIAEVPVLTLDSVSLGGLSVGPIRVVVLSLPAGNREEPVGLLGLNFLKHFSVLLDREHQEMRVSPR